MNEEAKVKVCEHILEIMAPTTSRTKRARSVRPVGSNIWATCGACSCDGNGC